MRLRERDAPAPPPREPRQLPRLPLIAALLALSVLAAAVAAGYLYDHSRRDLIAPGVKVGGVDIGGLRLDAARARLQRRLVSQLRTQPVVVRAAGRRFTLTGSQAHVQVAVDALASQALARSRQGSIVTRVLHGLDGQRVNVDLPIHVTYSHRVVRAMLARIAAAASRPAREASIVPSASGLSTTASRDGFAVDTKLLGGRVDSALISPRGTGMLTAPMTVIHPTTTTSELAGKFPAYIVIDRAGFRLRFYQHLKLASSYPIAVGRQGLETPAGLYSIQWKEVNPSWHVPNSPWAGALAGKVIPPGPQDPIKARWMAFNGGAGIHGTADTGSLGSAASHGCIRMAIPDVIALYSRVPVGTPVFVA